MAQSIPLTAQEAELLRNSEIQPGWKFGLCEDDNNNWYVDPHQLEQCENESFKYLLQVAMVEYTPKPYVPYVFQ